MTNSTSSCRCSKQGGSGWYLNEDDKVEECECMKQRIFADKKKFAEMPEQLRNFKIGEYKVEIYDSQEDKDIASKAKTICKKFVEEYVEFESLEKGLYFYSDTKGSGKTRLAVGIGNALIDRYKKRVKFITATRLIDEIKASFNPTSKDDYSAIQYMNAIMNIDVLILDDIGTEKLTDWVNEKFYEIINQRMLNKKITIFTSNCTIDELKHDDRIKSRIRGMSYLVKCPEQDIREKLGDDKNKLIDELIFE